MQIDAGGRVTKLLSKSKAKKGKTIRLTLDWSLQKTAEAALQQALEQAAAGGVFHSEYGDHSMTYAKNAASGAAVAAGREDGTDPGHGQCTGF